MFGGFGFKVLGFEASAGTRLILANQVGGSKKNFGLLLDCGDWHEMCAVPVSWILSKSWKRIKGNSCNSG